MTWKVTSRAPGLRISELGAFALPCMQNYATDSFKIAMLRI